MTDKQKDMAREIARRYCTLSPHGIETLAEILVPFKVNKGEKLMKEGEICSYMYYVERGMVRQFYYKGGRDVTEHFSYEGRIVICIESFLKQEPSRLMVEALETSWVFGIPYNKITQLIEVDREMAQLYRKILEHALISSQEHADSQRFENATERYVRLLKTKPEIVLRAPMVHVASFLQMTPETLSRVRAAQVE
jgi:CRP-like cAMP-binding protein